MGDVAAKAESQNSVSQLLGYGAGVGLLAVSQSAPYLYSIFAIAAPLHMALTAWMLRVATFELLTLPRLTWLAREYASGTGRTESEDEHSLPYSLPSLAELERREEIGFFGEFFKQKEENYLQLAPAVEGIMASPTPVARERWNACVEAFDVSLSRSICLYISNNVQCPEQPLSTLPILGARRSLPNCHILPSSNPC